MFVLAMTWMSSCAAATIRAEKQKEIQAQYERLRSEMGPAERRWEEKLLACLPDSQHLGLKLARVRGQSSVWDFVHDKPDLPRILLIGDSVSIGYTPIVRRELEGKANVHRAPRNCGGTQLAIKELSRWLGKKQWDLIHFNFGIHDHGTRLNSYRSNLEHITDRLKTTGAKLIWANTTPIPDGWKASSGSIAARNAVATRVMNEKGVVINDLNSVIRPYLETEQRPRDVHFKPAGRERLGKQVARVIAQHLD